MDEYKIDIIIPVYNNQDVVERCLKSLIAQTFSSWRALIVDDASTDGSAAIVKKYAAKDSRFIYLRNEKNLGVARTRNRALSMLRSEYAAFLDADDVWEKEMLAALYGCVEKIRRRRSPVPVRIRSARRKTDTAERRVQRKRSFRGKTAQAGIPAYDDRNKYESRLYEADPLLSHKRT